MFTKTKNALFGGAEVKGLVQRSGIISAIVTTIFIVIDGLATKEGVWAHLAANKEALMPLWSTALTTALVYKSAKPE